VIALVTDPLIPDPTPSFVLIAAQFGASLVARDFGTARALLTEELRAEFPVDALRARLDAMVAYGDGPPRASEVVTTLAEWPDKRLGDAGWAYVSIEGANYAEAVVVIVCGAGANLLIRSIEWGRP
jgi:hypothetical protein